MRDRQVRDFDFQAIVTRARALDTRRQPLSKRRAFGLGALAVAVPTVALGFTNRAALEAQIAAQLAAWNERSIRTTFLSAQATVSLATAKQRADFHFVLPTGLPDDARLESIEEIDHSMYVVTYRRAHARELYFSIRKRKAGASVRSMAALFVTRGDAIERAYRLRTYVWNVGDESVILASRGLAPKDVEGMDHAMGRSALRPSR
jgi:hypothetical protein